MRTGEVLLQGASNAGISPVGGETFLWTAAFVAREVTVIAPRGMTKDEMLKYYGDLALFLVCFLQCTLLGTYMVDLNRNCNYDRQKQKHIS